jgi:hypothetical protein
MLYWKSLDQRDKASDFVRVGAYLRKLRLGLVDARFQVDQACLRRGRTPLRDR